MWLFDMIIVTLITIFTIFLAYRIVMQYLGMHSIWEVGESKGVTTDPLKKLT